MLYFHPKVYLDKKVEFTPLQITLDREEQFVPVFVTDLVPANQRCVLSSCIYTIQLQIIVIKIIFGQIDWVCLLDQQKLLS